MIKLARNIAPFLTTIRPRKDQILRLKACSQLNQKLFDSKLFLLNICRCEVPFNILLKLVAQVFCVVLSISLCTGIYAQSVDSTKQTTVEWATHFGPSGPLFKSGYYDPSGTAQKLQSLDAAGSTVGDLVADTVGATKVGDLVELGFFDLDTNFADTVYTPNTTDDLFKDMDSAH